MTRSAESSTTHPHDDLQELYAHRLDVLTGPNAAPAGRVEPEGQV